MNDLNDSLLGKLYRSCDKAVEVLILLEQAIFNGFWLGVLREKELRYAARLYYDPDRNRKYYQDEYNRIGLYDWEQSAVREYFGRSGKLIVGAAGGGREVLALCRMGFEVDAFECHPAMVQYAQDLFRREGITARMFLAPFDRCPPLDGAYTGALMGWAGYTGIPGRAPRIRFLQELRRRLPSGAPLLASFFVRGGRGRSRRWTALIANAFRMLQGRSRVEVGDELLGGYVHHFTEEEIRSEFREGGFEMQTYSSVPYGHAVGLAR